ncbi:MAG: hypothetical protein O7F76_01760 [Planctomycetota bacterium]|nr:hypothetical protein [Planctomycetota bacterium]
MILDEIAKIQDAPPTSEEIADTKTFIAGAFAGQRETPEATVGDLWMIETEGLSDDFLQEYLSGIQRCTAEEVNAIAKSLIDAKNLTIVVVGEADAIHADLLEIAPVTVIGRTSPQPTEPEPTSS